MVFAIEAMQKEIEDDYNTLVAEVPEAERGTFTLDEFRHAWTLVDYNMRPVRRENFVSQAMLPFLNFMNMNKDG
jgi:hypothetical protein